MKAVAPGKLILTGEHAVVYGQPALAMAVNRNAQVWVTMEGAQDTVSFDLPNVSEGRESFTLRTLRDFHGRVQRNYQEFLAGELSIRDVLRKPVDLFQYAFVTVLDGLHLKMGGGVNVRLSSNIPMGCGMGSSAATILSVLRGLGHYYRVDFRPDWVARYSLEVENMQHGRASGLDTYVSMHGGCVRFQGRGAGAAAAAGAAVYREYGGAGQHDGRGGGECGAADGREASGVGAFRRGGGADANGFGAG